MAISELTRKALWGRAGNRCAICDATLVPKPLGGRPSLIGEECHIVARRPGGPRGDQPVPEVHGYDNLILLCANCHKLVDDQPEHYTTERLRQVKREQEERVEQQDPRLAETGPGRKEILDRALRESRARCAQRWQALGVARDLARELAEDPSVGALPEGRPVDGPVTLLTGDVGVGKSLAGERLHQAAIAAALDDPNSPAPVWLRAHDAAEIGLEPAVAEALTVAGDHAATRPVALVIDGLDEAGAAAAEILARARVLAEVRPGSRVVLTTRVLAAIGTQEERHCVRPLSDAAARDLMNRLDPDSHNGFYRLASPVRDAAHRPLFAVAAAVLASKGELATSPAELIDALVRRAVGNQWQALHARLADLAVRSVRRDGAAVRPQDVVAAQGLDELLATRIVVEDRGRLRFPLTLFAQWFAGQAIIAGTVSIDALLDDVARLENWRYPLAIAVSCGPEDLVAEVLGTLTRRQPALSSIVLSETVAQLPRDAPDVDDPLDAGRALRAAAQSWADGLGHLASWVMPLRADGTLRPLGVDLDLADDRGRLTISWWEGPPDQPDVFLLPPWRTLKDIPAQWGAVQSARPASGPAWPWDWVRNVIGKSLKHVLAHRALPVGGSPLEHEAAWDVVSRLVEHRLDGAIPIEGILARDPAEPIVIRDEQIDLRTLQAVLREQAGDDGLLRRPWPTKDEAVAGAGRDGWARRAEDIFRTALDAYAWLAKGLLAPLAPRLLTAALLPAVARGVVSTTSREIAWALEPARPGQGNQADFSRAGERTPASLMLAVRNNSSTLIKTLRPDAARWAFAPMHLGRGELESRSPATRLLYEWLWSDLLRTGLVSGQLAEWAHFDLPDLRAPDAAPRWRY